MKERKRSITKLRSVKPSGKSDDNFFSLVYEVARQIPRGRVTSYGAIAACLGTKLSARMVGWAMNGCSKVKPKVPAHRVVNRIGMLSGKNHFSPPGSMEKSLRKEGIKIKDDQVVDFEKLFWDPVKELGF
ncbi:MAG TPA: MGMT family protein [Chitinophagaceae bacterium]|nr:MGMT family protein [Chitinophagaceae bacterium]